MKTQLTSYKQKRNANTSLEEWNYAQKKKILPLIALRLSLVLTVKAASLCVPWQPFPGRAMPRGAQVLKTFNQSESLARQNITSQASQPPWAPKGKGMTWANIPLGSGGDLSTGNASASHLPPGLDHRRDARGPRSPDCSKTMNFTFFSSAHGTFSRIDHILGHKASLGKFKKIEIPSSQGPPSPGSVPQALPVGEHRSPLSYGSLTSCHSDEI